MQESTFQQPTAAAEQPRGAPAPAAFYVASLVPFPAMLQEVIVAAVLELRCERATDIFYEDEGTKLFMVMRQGFQWQLNETASTIWRHLGKRGEDIVKELFKEFPDTDASEIRLYSAEFLLQAYSYGLIDLEPPKPEGVRPL